MLLGLQDVLVSWPQLDEDKHKASASTLHHPLSLRITRLAQAGPYTPTKNLLQFASRLRSADKGTDKLSIHIGAFFL